MSQTIVRRFLHGSFVLGNTLYIDGGEQTSTSSDSEVIYRNTVNNTLALDLTQPFNSTRGSTLKVTSIDKSSAPVLNSVNYWVDASSSIAYAFGGIISTLISTGDHSVPLEKLWSFDGNEWKEETTSDATFRTLTRPAGGLSASGSPGGFTLGGFYSDRTSQKTAKIKDGAMDVAHGMVSFDFETKAWTNDSATGWHDSNTGVYGGMVHVPTWGKDGVLVALGGQYAEGEVFTDGEFMIDMSDVAVFDVENKKWWHQVSTGDVPSQRDRFCVVGVEGSNSTYEIFLSGGQSGNDSPQPGNENSDNDAFDEVFVLSLPSFTWTRADYTSSDPRWYHTCHAVGRSLVSIGGLNPSLSFEDAIQGEDPFELGIKTFDMTTLEWVDVYDPEVGEYKTPDAVARQVEKQFYPTTWSDPALQELFVSNSSSNGDAGSSSSSKSGPSPGAIAGGVIGAVAFVLFLGLGARLFWRHRRRARAARERTPESRMPELGYGEEHRAEVSGGSEYNGQKKAKPLIPVEVPGQDGWNARKGGHKDAVEIGNDHLPIELPTYEQPTAGKR